MKTLKVKVRHLPLGKVRVVVMHGAESFSFDMRLNRDMSSMTHAVEQCTTLSEARASIEKLGFKPRDDASRPAQETEPTVDGTTGTKT